MDITGPHSLQLWKYMTQIRDLEKRLLAFFLMRGMLKILHPASIKTGASIVF
jgi:hypothetical protein